MMSVAHSNSALHVVCMIIRITCITHFYVLIDLSHAYYEGRAVKIVQHKATLLSPLPKLP